ncbi:MAG: glycosyltransferase [Rhodobacteraceae bacterium]|nr:glycosyltransferase [Paracoccaceae bacterium]
MRIAIPIHSFEPGGVERVALRLAEQWQADGHEVVIVLGRDRGRCRGDAPALDYRMRPEPMRTDAWETPWMVWCLFQFLLRERVDVLFCPGNTYTIVSWAMKLLLGDRCPPVLVKISNDLRRRDLPGPVRPLYRLWLKHQGALLDRFVALAEPMEPELVEELEVPHWQVAVIPDPALSNAELARLAPCGEAHTDAAEGCHYLSIGRLSAQKNQALLLAAFAAHARAGDRLVIAGEGPARADLEQRIAALGLSGRVTLAGHVDDVAPLLAAADVFVLSSDYEGVPAAVLEALAAGLPLVATECCASMAWLAGEGRFGITVPTGDVAALGKAMVRARKLHPDREAMRRFAARFTLESSSGLYLAEMDRMVLRHRLEREAKRARPARDWRTRSI